MSVEGPVACGACGISLGSGISGGSKYCGRCARWVVTKAEGGSSDAIGGLIVLGAGIVVGAIAVAAVAGFARWLLGGDES